MITFSVDEIFEMACRIEHNGQKYYSKAAEQVQDEDARKLLDDLASWEAGHEKLFAEMAKDIPGREKTPELDPDDEAGLYLQAFVDGKVFDVGGDPSQWLTGRETLEEIIDRALGLEKDSIVFYLGIRDLVPAAKGRDRIEEIIREEMRHITVLTTRGKAGPIA